MIEPMKRGYDDQERKKDGADDCSLPFDNYHLFGFKFKMSRG